MHGFKRTKKLSGVETVETHVLCLINIDIGYKTSMTLK